MAELDLHIASPALDFILQRHSCHSLQSPAPNVVELDLIFQAALRAPDFGHLHPYRFIAAKDSGLDRLGQSMQRAAITAGKSEKTIARCPNMPHRAPLVLVIVSSPKASATVPKFDQQLCAASAVLMMQLAALALGYGSVWRSGWLMYDRNFHRELGLEEHEQIVGFLYLGTPAASEEPEPTPAKNNKPIILDWL